MNMNFNNIIKSYAHYRITYRCKECLEVCLSLLIKFLLKHNNELGAISKLNLYIIYCSALSSSFMLICFLSGPSCGARACNGRSARKAAPKPPP